MPIISTGETNNSYRYAGEQYDENLDGYYLRQRYYNPSIGRFVSQDPFEGILSDPQTLHNFAYVHNNPVMNVDPSGLLLFAWQAALVNIGILSATSTGVSLTATGVGTLVTGLVAIGGIAYAVYYATKEKTVGDGYVFRPKSEVDGHNRVFPDVELEKLWDTSGDGTDDNGKKFNQMRIQVQGDKGKVEESVIGINKSDPGVLKRQMNVAASQLFLMGQTNSITNFPKQHISALGGALGGLTDYIKHLKGGTNGTGTIYTCQWNRPLGIDVNCGTSRGQVKQGKYRTDLENIRGTNLLE